jgi:PAS domain S-box-containing protein
LKIKTKVIIIIASITLLLSALFFVVLYISFTNNYTKIENRAMQQDLERLKYALENEEITLNKQTTNWGASDDSYRFIEDHNPEYIESHFRDETFVLREISLLAVIDDSGRLVQGGSFDLENRRSEVLTADIQQAISAPEILCRQPGKGQFGILETLRGPLLFGSSPILTTDGRGPVRGTLVMGRFIDRRLIEKLSTITELPVTIDIFKGGGFDFASTQVQSLASLSPTLIKPLDSKTLEGYILMADIYGQPYLVAGTQTRREVHLQGQSMITLMLLGLALMGILITLINVQLLERFILSRIKKLRHLAAGVTSQIDFPARVRLNGKDEVKELDNDLNAILSRISMVNQQLKKSENKYRLLVENQTDLLVEIDPCGELLFVNPAFCQLMGRPKAELLGTQFESLLPEPGARLVHRPVVAAGAGPETIQAETRLRTSRGWRWIAWTANPVQDENGQLTSRVCLGRDETESKLARLELESANQKLVELDKLKDNFLSTVSHELRTPLTSIKSFAEILLNYDEDQATQKEFLGIINEESDRLTRLVNDFLDISKIQAGRMQWKSSEIALAETINSALTSVRPLIEKAGLTLTLDIEPGLPPIRYDRDRLIQVVTNLVGNATKFTPENGQIKVTARLDNGARGEPADFVTISIQDTGIGIAPENHERIFENFGQVGDVLKDRPKGTGLGLPICKKIIEHFGGRLWVESALGKGTTFLFTVPLSAVSRRAPASPNLTAGTAGQPEEPAAAASGGAAEIAANDLRPTWLNLS